MMMLTAIIWHLCWLLFVTKLANNLVADALETPKVLEVWFALLFVGIEMLGNSNNP
jgi:hypothetical protein